MKLIKEIFDQNKGTLWNSGYNGLDLKKGRHSKEQPLKKSIISSELTPPEKEELIRLRAAIVKEIREKGYRLKHLLKA